MPRSARVAPGGIVYHIINRANGRLRLFKKEEDFLAFYRVLLLAHRRLPLPILGWCIMGNHWHFVAIPENDGDLSRFFGYLSLTHATRWQVAHNAVGTGHVYQGRFKNFMIQEDEHLLWVLRYVERNPLRAGLVRREQNWKWSSLYARLHGPSEIQALLADWPADRPRNWVGQVNRAQTEAEVASIQLATKRGRPLGDPDWVNGIVRRYDLGGALRPRGRQPGWRKEQNKNVVD
jgi:putative transposase